MAKTHPKGHPRARVKNSRRAARKGRVPRWMRGAPFLNKGMGGTDKGGKNAGKSVYYSQKPAEK